MQPTSNQMRSSRTSRPWPALFVLGLFVVALASSLLGITSPSPASESLPVPIWGFSRAIPFASAAVNPDSADSTHSSELNLHPVTSQSSTGQSDTNQDYTDQPTPRQFSDAEAFLDDSLEAASLPYDPDQLRLVATAIAATAAITAAIGYCVLFIKIIK